MRTQPGTDTSCTENKALPHRNADMYRNRLNSCSIFWNFIPSRILILNDWPVLTIKSSSSEIYFWSQHTKLTWKSFNGLVILNGLINFCMTMIIDYFQFWNTLSYDLLFLWYILIILNNGIWYFVVLVNVMFHNSCTTKLLQ